ncbi:MAG: tetratricopeptide repeat protein [Thermodesulfobacteriota bacterium]|nr:tetratricopeptide repeat protein [Thermodesulfobacteriota bacterium]
MVMPLNILKLFLLLLFLLPLSAVFAGEPTPYQDGVAAFRAGNYQKALAGFEQARALGNQTPGLYYNLGVSFYKTGQYDKAAAAFLQLTGNPAWESLALYNLGLVAEAQGRRDDALAYYEAVGKKAENTRLAKIAAQKRNALLSETGPVGTERLWYGIVSVDAGYDDNAMLAPDDGIGVTSDAEDGFVELYAAAGGYLTGTWNNGVRLDGGVYTRGYSDETDYNAAVVFAGITRERQHRLWRTRAGLTVDADFDDDGHYATTPAVELALARDIATDYRINVYNTLYRIEARDTYTYLTGWRDRLGADVSRRVPAGEVTAGCEFEYNDRQDLLTEDEFFSYSPFRAEVHAEFDWRISPRWRLLLSGAFRKSIYPDANRQVNADGSITLDEREDDRWNSVLRGEYRLADHVDLFGEYRHTDNDSNFSRYAYTSNQIMMGLTLIY